MPECRIKIGRGLIGWVAKEKKRLHVTCFDRDTRTLGIYSRDVDIKALLAVPFPNGEGVLMVDSKNRYAFSEKKQRILEGCTTLAFDLWSLWKNHQNLDFYRHWSYWHLGLSGDIRHLLSGLGELLGMKVGFVGFQVNEASFVIEASIGVPKDSVLKGQVFGIDKGLIGWILRYKKHLILTHFGVDRHRSYFLWPDEPFEAGPVVIGLYQPLKKGALAWILTGDVDLSGWPGDFAEFLINSLDKAISERNAAVALQGQIS